MRIELDRGPIKRVVSVWRDFDPVPGEKQPQRVAVDSYGMQPPRPVARVAFREAPRLQTFWVDTTVDGDKLLAALADGPAKIRPRGDAWVIDLDRVKRP